MKDSVKRSCCEIDDLICFITILISDWTRLLEKKKQRCLSVIANFKKDLICAHYSKGTAKADIEKLVKDYLNQIKQKKMESYADYIDAIAFGILCDVNLEIFTEEMDNDLTDDLIGLLLGQEIVEKPSLNFETVYLPFYNFLSGKIDISTFENYMRDNWYDSCAECAWYEADKSSENIYVGYWCWLAAAYLKLTKKNVEGNISYIPIDMI